MKRWSDETEAEILAPHLRQAFRSCWFGEGPFDAGLGFKVLYRVLV